MGDHQGSPEQCPLEHFFLAMNPELFMPLGEFTARIDELVGWVKSGEKIEGVDEIVYPGERGQRRAAELTAQGRVPLNVVAWRTLETIRGELGIPLPEEAVG